MPIKGLTDRGMDFPQIGNIRKGAPKQEGVNRPGSDLQYFRVEFDEREKEAQEIFLRANDGNLQPVDIDIMLPFNEIEKCWDAWCEAYTAGRMVARSDGEYFVYLSDLATGKVIVQSGLNEKGERVPHKDVLGMVGKSTIKCRPVGRLRVIIPALRRLAYLVLHTTSIHDVRNISAQLQAIQQLNGGRLAGVPLILRRRPVEISTPDSNDPSKRVRRTKWLISIEANPAWVQKMNIHLSELSDPGARLGLPSGDVMPEITDDEETEEAEWSEADGDDPIEDETPSMTLKEAKAETNRNGKSFGDISSDKLQEMATALENALHEMTGEAKEKAERKLKAIGVILTARQAENE
jgi:hypothetical protein